ncbi:hypothetical protein LUZ61_013966 [Rhynchospora tenuis]|uniref:non-specific serine/threonine protein kinase n=1 Tax=Rhynchospora tenuis TaxID=198213 RepID=A0AAD5Z291_9POAL|nr:hypothetical protein LUZ61_013966 [Rhynchospora tenuis]
MAGDVDRLISFKNSLANPSLLSNWNGTRSVCEFQGVTCKSGHVSSLTIRGLPLGADFSSVSAHILSLQNLETLTLHGTNLTGSISTPRNCTVRLKELDLSGNNLRGSVSDATSLADSCASLQSLNLFDNSIGQIFNRASPLVLSRLEMLDLSFNMIATNADLHSLGSLSNLEDLIMWQNNLNGGIPAELSSLRSLRNLLLDYNNLSGIIPDDLVNCTSLNWISLANNQLTGPIPLWIGKLEKLVILILSNNSFSGTIPPGLGDSKGLTYLDLSSNQLNGSIPPTLAKQSGKLVTDLMVDGWLYVILEGSENTLCHYSTILLEFNGIRYDNLMRMPNIDYCNFTKVYTAFTEGYKSILLSMVHLDLSYNQLDGHIPTEISAMKSLVTLNLEHNRLLGELPQELGSLPYLELLNLSHNMLEGKIPSSFSTLSLSYLDLSYNQLSGPIPQSGSLPTFPAYAFENNSGLCGLPLPPCNGGSSISKGDAPQQSSTIGESSQGWWIALVLLFTFFFIIGFVVGLCIK